MPDPLTPDEIREQDIRKYADLSLKESKRPGAVGERLFAARDVRFLLAQLDAERSARRAVKQELADRNVFYDVVARDLVDLRHVASILRLQALAAEQKCQYLSGRLDECETVAMERTARAEAAEQALSSLRAKAKNVLAEISGHRIWSQACDELHNVLSDADPPNEPHCG